MNNLRYKTPMLAPVTGLIIGILIGFLGLPLLWSSIPVLIALILWLIKRKFHTNLDFTFRLSNFQPIIVILGFVAIGMVIENFNRPDSIDFEYDDNLSPNIIADVEEVKSMSYGQRAIVNLCSFADREGIITTPIHNLKAIIMSEEAHFEVGDRIMFINGLQRISQDSNFPNSSYKEYLELHNTIWQQNIDANHIKILSETNHFIRICNDVRTSLLILLEKSRLNRETTAFLATMLFGDNELLSSNTRTIFADSGIGHVLAVSGLHTGIIASLILLISSPLILLGWRKPRYAAIIFLTWGYVLISGWHISAIRSAIMVSVVLGGLILERRNSSFNALCLALFIILLFSPRAILDPSLQLSFLCVGTLIAFTSYDKLLFKKLPTSMARIISAAIVSILAVFGSWALSAYYFHSFPLLFLPINLIILPLLPFYLIIAILHLVLTGLGLSFYPIIFLLNGGYSVLFSVCQSLSEGAVLKIWVSAITPLLWTLGIAILAYAVHRRSFRSAIAASFFFVCSLLSIIFFPADRPKDGIIVRQTAKSVALAQYIKGEESLHNYRLGHAQALFAANKRICITGTEKEPQRHFPDSCDLLIVTTSRRSLTQLSDFFRPRKIILHSSLHYRTREKLIHESKQIGIPVYDMKETGSISLMDE